MDPSSKKSSFLPAVGLEAVLVAVLVILIIVTFNYFNIIPFSIPFLPHQVNVSKTTSPKNTQVDVYKFTRNPKCENLPAGIVIPTIGKNPPPTLNFPTGTIKPKIDINSTDPTSLKSYLGVWSGKWGDNTPTALIVSDVSNTSANTQYFFNGQLVNNYPVFYIQKDQLVSPDKLITWQFKNNTLVGTFSNSGKVTSTAVMTKCNL